MFNLPLTSNVLFVHHFAGVASPPYKKCQRVWYLHDIGEQIFRDKKKYFTQADADEEIKRLNKPELKINSYKCPVCQCWHIGKNKKKKYENIS